MLAVVRSAKVTSVKHHLQLVYPLLVPSQVWSDISTEGKGHYFGYGG